MKEVLIAASALLWASQAMSCDDTLFTIESWSEAAEQLSIVPVINIEARYHGDRPIRMVDAEYVLRDVLGAHIAEGQIERDVRLNPGDYFTFRSAQMLGYSGRIGEVDPDDVVASTCTRAVIYDDGAIEKFDSSSPVD